MPFPNRKMRLRKDRCRLWANAILGRQTAIFAGPQRAADMPSDAQCNSIRYHQQKALIPGFVMLLINSPKPSVCKFFTGSFLCPFITHEQYRMFDAAPGAHHALQYAYIIPYRIPCTDFQLTCEAMYLVTRELDPLILPAVKTVGY